MDLNNILTASLIICRMRNASFGLALGELFHVHPNEEPEEDDLVLCKISGCLKLAQYHGRCVCLENTIPLYDFTIIGVVEYL